MAENRKGKGLLAVFGCCRAEDESKSEVVVPEGVLPADLQRVEEEVGSVPARPSIQPPKGFLGQPFVASLQQKEGDRHGN